MDDIYRQTKEILLRYKELELMDDFEIGVNFKLYGSIYAIYYLNKNAFPLVLIVDENCEYPHFSLREAHINGHSYKYICLFDEGGLVEYTHTIEEKTTACIERLLHLVQMSKVEIIDEYHKEFLVYWNAACVSKGQYGQYEYLLFVDNEHQHQWLEQQIYKSKTIRITSSNRFFNDSTEKKTVQTTPVLFLPIIDSRELIPPLPAKPWSSKQIIDIIDGLKYQRISDEAYDEIKNTEFHKKQIFLVFKLNKICFGCLVQFSNSDKMSLLDKLKTQIASIMPLKISRCDYSYLNSQIGNQTSDKKIALIGAGSLGSYIANELVHAGYKNILIIDKDRYEYENTFRHRFDHFMSCSCKSMLVATSLNTIHPEINARYINDYLNEENYKKLLNENDIELIIFTVGSSDVQLRMNKTFLEDEFSVPVYYAWLEHDGETSHVAIINDFKNGCFECLYTSPDGDLGENVVNKADKTTIRYIRNGCGGTRVPYGNKTLLTASALILKAISDNEKGNALYSYYNDQIVKEDFPKNGRCKNCGLY